MSLSKQIQSRYQHHRLQAQRQFLPCSVYQQVFLRHQNHWCYRKNEQLYRPSDLSSQAVYIRFIRQ